jgi:hypothetical protein
MILSEYAGYTDQTLLDVTLPRIRQMVKVIAARREVELTTQFRLQLVVAQMQVSSTCMILAGLAQDRKQARAIQSAARDVDFLSGLNRKPEEPTKGLDLEKGTFNGRPLPSTQAVLQGLRIGGREGLMAVRG